MVAQSHADAYLGLAEQAAQCWMGPNETQWMNRLEIENDNLRTALDWYETREDLAKGIRLTHALWRFWLSRAYLAEGRKRLETLLTQMERPPFTPERARTLNYCGVLAYAQGDLAQAQTYLETGLEMSRSQGKEAEIAFALNSLGMVMYNQSKKAAALALYEESLEIRRRLNDKAGIAATLNNLGYILMHAESSVMHKESFMRAQACFEESLALREELGDEAGRADSLGGLGYLAREQSDPRKAIRYMRESLELSVRMEHYRVVIKLMDSFGIFAIEQGNAIRGVPLTGAASALRTVIGLSDLPSMITYREKHFVQARRQLGEEAFQAAYAAGQKFTLEEAIAEARKV